MGLTLPVSANCANNGRRGWSSRWARHALHAQCFLVSTNLAGIKADWRTRWRQAINQNQGSLRAAFESKTCRGNKAYTHLTVYSHRGCLCPPPAAQPGCLWRNYPAPVSRRGISSLVNCSPAEQTLPQRLSSPPLNPLTLMQARCLRCLLAIKRKRKKKNKKKTRGKQGGGKTANGVENYHV